MNCTGQLHSNGSTGSDSSGGDSGGSESGGGECGGDHRFDVRSCDGVRKELLFEHKH